MFEKDELIFISDFQGYVTAYIDQLIDEQMPHLRELFPFQHSSALEKYADKEWICVRLRSKQRGIDACEQLKDESMVDSATKLAEEELLPRYEKIKHHFGEAHFTNESFVYFGKCVNYQFDRDHLSGFLVDWINDKIILEILELNKRRVLEAIPITPRYAIQQIIDNLYVLESEQESRQGTCFHLQNIGLITCEHVLAEDLKVFSHHNFNARFDVKLIASDATIDIAILLAPDLRLGEGLKIGSSDLLKHMDHIAIAGFPNYNYGDSGILSPGFIIGFRTVSAIRRILVNTPIVAGNSGGPALNADGEVIGVAVTGADSMENASHTEKHGVVPIEALRYLSQKIS